ncbi:MAG TPA: nitrilase-related carbon-nitrogen hydrolase [Stenomitos sp.]
MGLALFVTISDFAGHPWQFAFIDAYLPGGLSRSWPLVPLLALVWLGPQIAVLYGAWRMTRRPSLPLWLWLPAAWILGEAAHRALTGVDHGAWLYSQWQNPWVLRAVAAWGWHAALLVALVTATALAEVLGGAFDAWRTGEEGRPRVALVLLVLGGLSFALMPPLRGLGPKAFEGIAAVHLQSIKQPVGAVSSDLRLLVWPELTLERGPALDEGASFREVIPPPLRSKGLHHLLGVQTSSRRGLMNAIAALAPGGRVLGVRAKSHLFPLTETPAWGAMLAGATPYAAGSVPPLLEVEGRRLGVLICLEAMDRSLAAAAKRAGASLLVVSTVEAEGASSELGQANLLGVDVLRAVETGLPLMRSAQGGCAAFIDRDGRLLSRSSRETTGLLTAQGDRTAPTAATSGAPKVGQVAVLCSRRTPELLPQLPASAMRLYPIEGYMRSGAQADTVIVSGEGVPPYWLGVPAERVAECVAGFHPRLVILDTCYGASLQLLEALVAAGVQATVVGPAYPIPASGLVYGPDFLKAVSPDQKAQHVRTDPPYPLLRWAVVPSALAQLRAEMDRWGPFEFRSHLFSAHPSLVRLNLPGRPEPSARVLAWVAPSRFSSSR